MFDTLLFRSRVNEMLRDIFLLVRPRTSKIHGHDSRKYVIFLKGRRTLYEISRERNKIFTYFFHDNKDHLSGRNSLQYQLITSILSGVKHPSPISAPKIARFEN